MTEHKLYKTIPDNSDGRAIFWQLERVMNGYFKDSESSDFSGHDVYYGQSVYEPVTMRHSEDEIYFDVLKEVEEIANRRETLNYHPEKWGYVQFEARAFYWDTFEDVPFSSRIWSLDGKPLDGHTSPYYIQADERKGKGWENKSIGIELAEQAISTMINQRAYDTKSDMRCSWRVIDRNGKQLAIELPWVELEKEEEAQRAIYRERYADQIKAKLAKSKQEGSNNG